VDAKVVPYVTSSLASLCEQKIVKSADGTITALEGELNPTGDFKKTKLKLTWLADIPDVVDLQLQDFGYLITKPKPEEEDEFENLVPFRFFPVKCAYCF
jgi:hypothetical protein